MNVISGFTGEYAFLSNFHESIVEFERSDGRMISFTTAEAAFQASKYLAMDCSDLDKMRYVHKIQQAVTPKQAKFFGGKVDIDLDKWESIKVDCMRQVIYSKFSYVGPYGPTMARALLKTGDAMLVESNNWSDTYWGRCNGKGYNKLGVVLMEVRGSLLWENRRAKMSEQNVEMGS